jgi:hypothetical protein
MLKRAVIAALVLMGSAFVLSLGAGALGSRNPFGMPDVIAPDGPDVVQLAARPNPAKLFGPAMQVGGEAAMPILGLGNGT